VAEYVVGQELVWHCNERHPDCEVPVRYLAPTGIARRHIVERVGDGARLEVHESELGPARVVN